MFVATVIVSALLAAVGVASSAGKLTRQPRVMETMEHVGVTRIVPILASFELAGAIGVLVGLGVPALGMAAALGLSLYFTGAVISHIRVHDAIGTVLTPAPLALLAIAALVLRIASA